jgi:hypothetical protein
VHRINGHVNILESKFDTGDGPPSLRCAVSLLIRRATRTNARTAAKVAHLLSPLSRTTLLMVPLSVSLSRTRVGDGSSSAKRPRILGKFLDETECIKSAVSSVAVRLFSLSFSPILLFLCLTLFVHSRPN